jgi:Rieske 2Fe-2S family protein
MSDTRETLRSRGFEPSLHARWYLDESHFARECRDIFHREWLCVAREEDLPKPGDHRLFDLQGESVLLVRNRDGQLRAFYNVCRHRGAQLCAVSDDPHGAGLKGGVLGGRLIRCPYHAWTYDLDGRLVNAPFMDQQTGFDAEDIALHPVGVACWGGFVFFNLQPDEAPDFPAQMAGVRQRLVRYGLADLHTGAVLEYTVRANWKVICENYNECYHCGPVHPELCAVVPAFRDHGGADLDWDRGIPHREGATTFTATGETTRASFPALNTDEQTRHKGEMLLPNLFLSLARDHVAAFLLQPVGPTVTNISCRFLFAEEAIREEDFDPSDAVEFWDVVNRQDWAVCEAVQRGMGARVFDYGALSPLEDWSLDVRRYVMDRTGLGEQGMEFVPPVQE